MKERLSGIIWLITRKCNLSCIHCYVADRFKQELSTEECLRILREAAELDVRFVGLTGGEPLIVFDKTRKIVEEAYRLGISTSIQTNGTLIDRTIAEWLANYDVFTYVSLDGPTEEIHDAVRGKGTWSRTIRGIELLSKLDVEFTIVMAVSKINYKYASSLIELAENLGACSAAVIPVIRAGRARSNITLNSREWITVLRKVSEYANELRFPLSIWCAPFALLVAKSPYVRCYSCRRSSVVDVDPMGRLLLCDVLDIAIADLRELRFSEALKIFDEHPLNIEISEQIPKECADCPIREFCRGGCYARAYIERGSLNLADPLCPRLADSLH
ncbi:MAG: radical SAM protein [Thermoprotei archaeon]|nr:MAG: radical SAM protein [Thermoprotei archaeon]